MKTVSSYLVLIALVFAGGIARAQENRLYSQYTTNMLAINPAYAGNQYQFNVTAANRAQWTGIKGAPITQTLTTHFRETGSNHGIGILVYHDKIGIHNNTQLFGSYSYIIKGKRFNIAMGLQGGFEMLRSNYNDLSLNDAVDAQLNGNISAVKPNFGGGIFIDNGKGYIGFSVPTILEHNDLAPGAMQTPRYYILAVCKVWELSRSVVFKPSLLARYQHGAPLNGEVNTTFIFNSIVFAGVSYRTSKTVVANLQLQLNTNFRFGYAFDYAMNSLSPYGTGSHELMLNYRINLIEHGCHTYY
jgi:type IX secretion system PorP/SprF family membrane protein